MTVAEFKTMMPEFQNELDANVTAALSSASLYLDPVAWDTFYGEGLANLAAHRLATSGKLGAATAKGDGAATSKTVGSATIMRDGQNIAAQMANPFLRTIYGQRYQYLVNLTFGGTTLAT